MNEDKYFIIKQKAVPEVLFKVVEAKRLLETKKAATVQEATDMVGISRSSFYKYKDYIFPFHENARGRTITFMLQVDDKPGFLSSILNTLADNNFNILTIHQSIPVNKIASVTLSAEIPNELDNVAEAFNKIEILEGVHYLKILARE